MAGLTKCEACGREISEEAKACPGCGHPVAQAGSPLDQKAGCGTWALVGGGIIAALVVIAIIGGEQMRGTAQDACLVAQKMVTNRLKSPTTAEFSSCYSYDHDKAVPIGGTVLITGTVDSENGFGAKVRSSWSATMTHRGDGEWAGSNFDIETP